MTLWQRLRAMLGLEPRGQERQMPLYPPGYPRPRVEPTPPPLFPSYPTPDILGPIQEQREPINYLNLHLPDGSTVPIIPLLRLPLLTPGTWTNNSPSAGYVSWAGCQIAHEGQIYTITDGNTNLKYIWWDKSASPTTFQVSDTKPTLNPLEDLLIAYNNAGTAEFAFLSNLIQAGIIICQQLDVLSANMGLLTAGEIRLGTGTPGVDFTGIRIYKSGSTYRVGGYLNNTLRAYLDSDGALRAGGGDVILDENGIYMFCLASGAYLSRDAIKWMLDSLIVGEIYSLYTGTSPNRNPALYLRAVGEGTGTAAIVMRAGTREVGLIEVNERLYLTGLDLLIASAGRRIKFGDSLTEIWKDASGNLTLKDAVAGTKTEMQLASISQSAEASAILTLTITKQDVPGCSLSLGAGTWLVFGNFAFRGNNQGSYAIGYLDVGGVEQTRQAQWRPAASADAAAMANQLWRITLSATTTVKLQAKKSVDVGVFTAQNIYTNITALRTAD